MRRRQRLQKELAVVAETLAAVPDLRKRREQLMVDLLREGASTREVAALAGVSHVAVVQARQAAERTDERPAAAVG